MRLGPRASRVAHQWSNRKVKIDARTLNRRELSERLSRLRSPELQLEPRVRYEQEGQHLRPPCESARDAYSFAAPLTSADLPASPVSTIPPEI